jgi:hypothetical protein
LVFVLLAFMLQSMPGRAATSVRGYDLDIKLKVNGAEVSAPRLLVRSGETARVTQSDGSESTAWEVRAVDEDNQKIRIRFSISRTDESGHRSVISKPQMVVLENEEAELTVSGPDRKKLTLSVMARRKSL